MTIPVLAVLLAGAVMQQQTDTTFAIRPGARLNIEVNGRVTVRTWNRHAVRVQATHDRRTRVEVSSTGSSVRVEAARSTGNAGNADFVFTVPADISIAAEGVSMDADVQGVEGEVDLENTNGNLRVVGGRGRVKLESVQGDIVLSGANGRVDVYTVNRGIHLTNVRGTVVAETVNGPIVMEGMQASSVDAGTVNGMVVYDGALRAGGDYSLVTHNGPVWLVMPRDAGATIKVATFNGTLDPSFPVTVRKSSRADTQRFSFVIGNGSAEVVIESFGGDVRLRRPGEARPGFSGVTGSGSKK